MTSSVASRATSTTSLASTSADGYASTLRMKARPPLKKGDAVRVPKYGRGTVAEVYDDRIAVTFASGDTREFAPRYVAPVSSR